jgi:hypothetical protein
MTGDGTVTASVGAGGASDLAGNGNAASTSTDNSVTYDTTGPTVAVAPAAGQDDPSTRAPIVFAVTLSEPVTGFDAADVGLGSSTAPGTLVAAVAGSGDAYTVTVSGMVGAGDITLTIPAGVAVDAATNPSAAATGPDLTIAFAPVAPVVTGITRAAASPTNAASVAFRVTFSDTVGGVDSGDFALDVTGLSGASISGLVGSGAVYTVTVSTGTGTGSLGLNLIDDDSITGSSSGLILGGVGAGNGDFSGESYAIDRIAPLALGLTAPTVTAGALSSSFIVTFTDNLAVARASLGNGDVIATGPGGFSQAATLEGVSPAGDGTPLAATFRITAPGGSWNSADNGSYTLALVAGAVADTAGNQAVAATIGSFSVNLPQERWVVYLPLIAGASPTLPDLVVESITTSAGRLEVTLHNRGGSPVTTPFWVELYLNPTSAPTAVNQIWPNLGSQGAVWGVTANALPLAPGARLTLTLGGAYYRADMSQLPATIGSGSTIYVQADSANSNTTYGAVLEQHEARGEAYNNITRVITTAPVGTSSAPAGAPLSDDDGLPQR